MKKFSLFRVVFLLAVAFALANVVYWFVDRHATESIHNGLLEAERIKKASDAKSRILTITSALSHFQLENHRYPTTKEGLAALVNPGPAGSRPFLEEGKKGLTDPWGREYHYESPGKHNSDGFDLWSEGPDEKPDTGDEIGNWETAK